MMFRVLLVFASIAAPLASAVPLNSNANSCPYPNGSDTSIHFWSCAKPSDTFSVNEISVTDLHGKPMYPVDLKKPIVLNLKSFNKGAAIIDDKAEVHVYEYKKGWASSECKWSEIPTFGLLSSIDECAFTHNCPLEPGVVTLKLQLDLSQFQAIIALLTKDMPLQLFIRLRNYNPGNIQHEEMACVYVQYRIA